MIGVREKSSSVSYLGIIADKVLVPPGVKNIEQASDEQEEISIAARIAKYCIVAEKVVQDFISKFRELHLDSWKNLFLNIAVNEWIQSWKLASSLDGNQYFLIQLHA